MTRQVPLSHTVSYLLVNFCEGMLLLAPMKSDFLVIGCGIAGLSFALKAACHGKVVILTKGSVMDSNTAWAQGGISAVLEAGQREEGDSEQKHVQDTLGAGAGLCHEDVVRAIIESGDAAIQDLVRSGVDLTKFQKHLVNLLWAKKEGIRNDASCITRTRRGISAQSLIEKVKQHENITLLEQHFAIDLLTAGKLGAVTQDRVLGAYVLDECHNRVKTFRSDRVLLATGGCGKVYLYTTNPDAATGDGVAMAWRAGCLLRIWNSFNFIPPVL